MNVFWKSLALSIQYLLRVRHLSVHVNVYVCVREREKKECSVLPVQNANHFLQVTWKGSGKSVDTRSQLTVGHVIKLSGSFPSAVTVTWFNKSVDGNDSTQRDAVQPPGHLLSQVEVETCLLR